MPGVHFQDVQNGRQRGRSEREAEAYGVPVAALMQRVKGTLKLFAFYPLHCWSNGCPNKGDGRFQHPATGEPLAQEVEHRPFKARALGSNPRRLTTYFNDFHTGFTALLRPTRTHSGSLWPRVR